MRSGSKSFPTRNGMCQIFSDRIEFQGNGLMGKLSNWLYAKGFKRISIIYGLLFIGFLLALGISLWLDNYFLAFFFSVSAVLDLYALWLNKDISMTPLIIRRNIQHVNFQQAIEGKARASFEILFEEDGSTYKKKVSLPSLMQNGAAVANSAYWIFRDEGLLKE